MKSKSFNAVIFETLDSRRLLSGSVVGTAFVDTHGEGNQSLYRYPVGPVNPNPRSVEPWAGNLSVYIDLDHSGTLTPADRVTQTSQYGDWNFYKVPAGSYKVYVVPPAEYDAWQPDGVAVEVVDDVSLQDVVLTLKPANSQITTIKIIDDKGENFEGYIYIDSNNNGVREIGRAHV